MSIKIEIESNNNSLLDLLQKWDNSNASHIHKQRFRIINTIFKRNNYSNKYKDNLAY